MNNRVKSTSPILCALATTVAIAAALTLAALTLAAPAVAARWHSAPTKLPGGMAVSRVDSRPYRWVSSALKTTRAGRAPRARLAVRIQGLPARAWPSIVVKGPQKYHRTLRKSAKLRFRGKGWVTVRAKPVHLGSRTYRPEKQTTRLRARPRTSRTVIVRFRPGVRPVRAPAQPPSRVPAGTSVSRYQMGDIDVSDVWVDGTHGSDRNDGSATHPLRTVTEAWTRIPADRDLTQGVRIQVRSGRYAESMTPNYWENRRGTAKHPIILNAVDGAHTVRFDSDINMYATRYFYLTGIDVIRDQDAFHCERCDHVLVRNVLFDGDASAGGSRSHDLLKVNQSQNIYIEDSEVRGAEDNAIDFVAVQSGHIIGTKVHDAGDWCAYAKGGSAYLTVADNEFYACGVGGFTAGQGTGFEFMVSPWITYEAMGIAVVNNVIHDTENAGLGVQGGYNVLIAYNTLYRVGKRDALLLFQHGSRSCDAYDASVNAAACVGNLNRGGWGTATTGGEWVPNRHVFVYNNVIANPSGYESRWQQLSVHAPASPPARSHIMAPSVADDDLRIVGNVIWNGGAGKELGIGDGTGCRSNNPTCNPTQIIRDNRINTLAPAFRNASGGDFVPIGALASLSATAIPDFGWGDVPLGAPAGSNVTAVPAARDGQPRDHWGRPGAY